MRFTHSKKVRSYHVERTGSHPITEVKERRAQSVLGWVTTLEYWVPYAFYPFQKSTCVAYVQHGLHSKFYRIRPYYVEHTGSRSITEVKHRRAQSVLGWVTTLGYWVPYAFYLFQKKFVRCLCKT